MFLIVNKHKRIKALLSPYIDEELRQKERDLVERHLAACKDCLKELESLRATIVFLKRMPLAVPDRNFLVSAEKEAKPRPSPPIWRPVPVPVIISVLLTVALFLGDILNALPYSDGMILTGKSSAPAPLIAPRTIPQAAEAIAPTPSPFLESLAATKPSAISAETQTAEVSQSKTAKAAPDMAKGGVSEREAQVVTPGSARAEGLAGVGRPAAPPPSFPQPAPVPVPQTTLPPQPAPVSAQVPALVPQTPAPEMKAGQPLANAGPVSGQGRIAKTQVPAAASKESPAIIPWRQLELLLAIITGLIIIITILKRKRASERNL